MSIKFLGITLTVFFIFYLWARRQAKLCIEQKIIIEVPVDQIFQVIADFNQWSAWSPWLLFEKNASYTVCSGGKKYTWDGQVVGKGEILTLKQVKNEQIEQKLTFLKPFPSKAKVRWLFKSAPKGTEVSWTMNSRMPFFLFWMAKQMNVWVSNDYRRGLQRLKEYVETGKIDHKVEVTGLVDFQAISFLRKKTHAKFDQIKKHMEEDFTALHHYLNEKGAKTGNGISLYEKMDMVSNDVIYVAGMIGEFHEFENDQFKMQNIPSIKVFKVVYQGDYSGLDNGWATLMAHVRAHKLKCKKGVFPFEYYASGPHNEKDPSKWVTEIYMPIQL